MANPSQQTRNSNSLTFTQQLTLLGIYCCLGLLALFPLVWMRSVGSKVGKLYYSLAKKRVHIARINLTICYPQLSEQERERLVKKSFKAAGQWFFEAGAIWLWSTERLLKTLTVANMEVLQAAIAEQKGVLLVIPHIGNWEIMGPFTTRHSSFACFYQHDSEGQALNEFVLRRRMRNGTIMAPANASGIRRLYKHLRAGKVAGILPDHFPSKDMGIFAPFFGRPVFTGTITSDLARKNNAIVLAAAVIRTDKGFTLHFIKVDNQHSDDPVVAATGINKAVEDCIALAPEQFQWTYSRFRKHPDPENFPNPYRSNPI